MRRSATPAGIVALAAVVVAAGLIAGARPARADDDVTARARAHYEMGLHLFDAREHDQALIEFITANELKPRPAAVFMMAQCEYLLGRLKEARTHYQDYVKQSPDGEFVELAKDRIQSIDRRPGTFFINTDPDEVDVRIVSESAPANAPVTGQAPNNFPVPRGRYRITVSKKNYVQQTRVVDIDLAETRPLFFKLAEIQARLEIETGPPGATLYVNGNRTRNPYRQDVPPGHYEVIGEAVDHDQRTIEFMLSPGERKLMVGGDQFILPYTQRSGRPELIVAAGIIGAFIGAGGVAAGIGGAIDNPGVASVFLATGGGIAGGIAGALIATPLVPRYIPDNRALFILGTMWMGAAEGAATGIIWQQVKTYNGQTVLPCPGPTPCRGPIGDQLRAGFIGTLPGLAVGLTAGALSSKRAPKYGRVALIQSAALGGAFTGALVQLAAQRKPYGSGWEYTVRFPSAQDFNMKGEPITGGVKGKDQCSMEDIGLNNCAFPGGSVLDLMPGALIGLNVGLVSGLLGAYLPDQSRYGPSWKRVLLIDLAALAGALGGGIAGCVSDYSGCLNSTKPDDNARAAAAIWALSGGAIGAVGGLLLTQHYDEDTTAPSNKPRLSLTSGVMPLRAPDGQVTPGLGAFGTF